MRLVYEKIMIGNKNVDITSFMHIDTYICISVIIKMFYIFAV